MLRIPNATARVVLFGVLVAPAFAFAGANGGSAASVVTSQTGLADQFDAGSPATASPTSGATPDYVAEPLRELPEAEGNAVMGDLVSSQRKFGSWTLECQGLLSERDKVCAIVEDAPGGFSWRVDLTRSLQPVVVVDAGMDLGQGQMTIESGTRMVTFPKARCTGNQCEIVVAFAGVLEDILADGAAVTVLYGSPQNRNVILLSGEGFPQAVSSLSGPPDKSLYGAVACGMGDARWPSIAP